MHIGKNIIVMDSGKNWFNRYNTLEWLCDYFSNGSDISDLELGMIKNSETYYEKGSKVWIMEHWDKRGVKIRIEFNFYMEIIEITFNDEYEFDVVLRKMQERGVVVGDL